MRQALKQFSFMAGHVAQMEADSVDFYYCAMKRVNLTTFTETMSFRDDAHVGKWAVKGCSALLKALARIRRDTDSEKEVEKVQKEYEEHKETEAYKKWKKDFD